MRLEAPIVYATPEQVEALRTWLPSTFDTVGVRMIDGWQALRGGSFAVPEPRPEPPLMYLQGFAPGRDLRRFRTFMPQGWWCCSVDTWNADVARYNAALCARGLDRWEDDGGR